MCTNSIKSPAVSASRTAKDGALFCNTAAASVPLVLSELVEQGRVGPGSRLLLTAFGGGLTWGGMIVEYKK